MNRGAGLSEFETGKCQDLAKILQLTRRIAAVPSCLGLSSPFLGADAVAEDQERILSSEMESFVNAEE